MRERVRLAISVALLTSAVWPVCAQAPGSEPPFLVTAVFEPGERQQPAHVALRFSPSSADLKVNRTPAPRLELAKPGVLTPAPAEKAEAPAAAGFEPQYLPVDEPYRLPFTLSAGAKGPLEGQVIFFYCSKAAAWCKKGTAQVTLALP